MIDAYRLHPVLHHHQEIKEWQCTHQNKIAWPDPIRMLGKYQHEYHPKNTEQCVSKHLDQINKPNNPGVRCSQLHEITDQLKSLAEQDQSSPTCQSSSIPEGQIQAGLDRNENSQENQEQNNSIMDVHLFPRMDG